MSNQRGPVGSGGTVRYSDGVMATTASVLVTGATGFVGREVVRRLLAGGRRVVALARARGGASARDRLAATLGAVPDSRTLDVVTGDLGETGAGLDVRARQRLRRAVETVIHCAGDTSFFPDDPAEFRAGHIDGPVDLLRSLAGGRLRQWAQLSTAYVCGTRRGRVLETDGDVGQEFHNPYERVKLEAEAALRAAAVREGLDLRIFRPSIVVGSAPATAGGTPSNLFFDFIRMIATLARLANGEPVSLRIAAAPRAPFNIVPVEYVATALVTLADDPDAAGGTFHLVVSDPPRQTAMLAMMTAPLRLQGLSVVDPAALRARSPLEEVVARMAAPYQEYLEQDVVFDDRLARRLLQARGVPPAVLSAESVAALVHRALLTPPSPAASRSSRARSS